MNVQHILRRFRKAAPRQVQEEKKVDLVEQCLDATESVEGQISRNEAARLLELARTTAAQTAIVEIGSYRGRSTVALAFGSRLGNRNRVHAVDPHVEFRGYYGGQFGPQDMAAMYQNIARANLGELIAVINLPSVAAARSWTERNISLLWIDGDHRYEGVRADYDAWVPFVQPGGVIAFHDTPAPGVEQLIRESTAAGQISRLGLVDCLSWYRKVA
jgi:predicted O-methyltransferase YrrM